MQLNNPSYNMIRNLMNKYKGKKIVDNGCGKNEFKQLYNKKIIGIEVNKNNKADLCVNGVTLPFKNNSVDLFLSNFVLEHVDNQTAYLKEMRRCLKNNGKIILSVPTPFWYFSHFISLYTYWNILKNIKKFLKNPLRFLAHGHPKKHGFIYEIKEWKEENYEKLFKKTKLNIIEKIKSCNFLSLDYYYAKIFGKMKFPKSLSVHVTYVLTK